jgi:hypothetical protein
MVRPPLWLTTVNGRADPDARSLRSLLRERRDSARAAARLDRPLIAVHGTRE